MSTNDQPRKKRLPPAGKCLSCGAEFSMLTMDPKQRCPDCGRGPIGSRMTEGDWRECETCGATGFVGSQLCMDCDGKGWLHARKN